jgi:uncharacterized protein (DUF1684 family)
VSGRENITWGVNFRRHTAELEAITKRLAALGLNSAMIELQRRVKYHDTLYFDVPPQERGEVRAMNNAALAELRLEVIDGMSLSLKDDASRLQYFSAAHAAAAVAVNDVTNAVLDKLYDNVEVSDPDDEGEEPLSVACRFRAAVAGFIYRVASFVAP